MVGNSENPASQRDVPGPLSFGVLRMAALSSLNQPTDFRFEQCQPVFGEASICLCFPAQSSRGNSCRNTAVLVQLCTVPSEALCHWGIVLCSYPNKAGLHTDRDEPNQTKSITSSKYQCDILLGALASRTPSYLTCWAGTRAMSQPYTQDAGIGTRHGAALGSWLQGRASPSPCLRFKEQPLSFSGL